MLLANASAILGPFNLNSTTNRTEVVENEKILSLASLVCLSVLNAVSSVIGTFGNVIVLIVIVKNAALHTVPDMFIFNLAIADLLVAAVQQPLLGIRIFLADRPVKVFNTVLQGIGNVALLASVSGIFTVTIDRFIAIQFPFLYERIFTKARAMQAISVLWILCLCGSVAQCLVQSPTKYYFIWSYISLLLLLTLVMYVYLFIAANKQQKKIANEATPGDIASADQDGNANPQQTGASEIRRQKKERKAAKTVAIVVGVFLAFWSPFLGYTISRASIVNTPKFLRGFYWVWAVSLWNSAINPYIFCARNTRYRSAFARVLGLKSRVELEPSQEASFQRSLTQTERSDRLPRGVGSVDICW